MRMLAIGPKNRALLALAALNLLLELPLAVQPDGLSVAALRLSGDLVLLMTVWLAARHTRGAVRMLSRTLLASAVVVLIAFHVDEAVCRVLMRHEPVLYDQQFLLRHLGVLLFDLWGGWSLAVGVGTALVVTGLVRGVLRLLAVVSKALPAPPAWRAVQGALALSALVLALATAQHDAAPRAQLVHLGFARMLDAVSSSRRLATDIERGLRASPYRSYDALRLSRKPRVLWFFVESYGRVVTSDPQMRGTWQAAIAELERAATRTGFHVASAFSAAPVSGNRSWLAHASVLTGMRVDHQALFLRLVQGGRLQVPNLVDTLRKQGYRAVLLAPGDRERAGVRVDNPYGYDRMLTFADLGYDGPFFGWGRIPDQYALSVADERVLRETGAASAPLFFNFVMVSSHAPWWQAPRLIDDARDLTAYARQHDELVAPPEAKQLARGTLRSHVERFAHEQLPRDTSHATLGLRSAYAQTIAYDLALIAQRLASVNDDALIVVMGDHQPPLVTPADQDLAVPVHVFARDPALLQELYERGFRPTLRLAPDAPCKVAHAGLFSLVMRDLARASGSAQPWPAYLPAGAQLFD